MTSTENECVVDQREIQSPDGCYSLAMRRSAAVLVLAALAVAACSGSDDAATTSPTATSAPATTVAEPTTTPDSVTTTAVETTSAPPTTVDDGARLRTAEQAYIAAWEATWNVFRDPRNAELREDAESRYTDANLEQLVENIDSLVEDGYTASPSPTAPASATIAGPARFINDERTMVDLVVCEVNTDWFFEVGAAPDGSDALLRDEPVAVLIVARVELVGGDWKPRGGDVLSEVFGAETCDG
jgi:hypothetical protein